MPRKDEYEPYERTYFHFPDSPPYDPDDHSACKCSGIHGIITLQPGTIVTQKGYEEMKSSGYFGFKRFEVTHSHFHVDNVIGSCGLHIYLKEVDD